jgi:hypothetical protein
MSEQPGAEATIATLKTLLQRYAERMRQELDPEDFNNVVRFSRLSLAHDPRALAVPLSRDGHCWAREELGPLLHEAKRGLEDAQFELLVAAFEEVFGKHNVVSLRSHHRR